VQLLGQKKTEKFAFSWDLEQTFEEFLPNFPLALGYVSLTWPANPNATVAIMNTTNPAIPDVVYQQQGVEVVQDMWVLLKDLGHIKSELVPQPVETDFDNSTAAFAMTVYSPLNNDDELRTWATFYHEYAISGPDKWLMSLGLCIGSAQLRVGPHSYAEFASAAGYAHRVYTDVSTKVPYTVLRFKLIYIEQLLYNALVSMVQANLIMNNQSGTPIINQSGFDNDVFADTSIGTITYGLYNLIMRKLCTFSWVGFDVPPCSTCQVIAGTLAVPGAHCDTGIIPTWLNETIASMMPIKNTKKGWNYCTYPLIVSAGGFVCANVPENNPTGDPTDLMGVVAQYHVNVNLHDSVYLTSIIDEEGVADHLNFFDLTHSLVLGGAIPNCVSAVSNIFNTLQGNLDVSLLSETINTMHSILHYTQIGHFFSTVTSFTYSPMYLVVLSEVSNRVPFDPNSNGDLARILPLTFAPGSTYKSIFSESSSVINQDENVFLTTVNAITSSAYAHPISGAGFYETMEDRNNQMQHMGGGFGTLKDIMGIVGPISEALSMLC